MIQTVIVRYFNQDFSLSYLYHDREAGNSCFFRFPMCADGIESVVDQRRATTSPVFSRSSSNVMSTVLT